MSLDYTGFLNSAVSGSFGVLLGWLTSRTANKTGKVTAETALSSQFLTRITELEKMIITMTERHSERMDKANSRIDELLQERLDLKQRIDQLENTSEKLQEDYIDCEDQLKRLAQERLSEQDHA